MRISDNTNIEVKTSSNTNIKKVSTVESMVKYGNKAIETEKTKVEQVKSILNSEETKAKIEDAVNKMNEMLDINNSASKFMYHEGLERYYVTVVDRETEEVVKEIPPKKLLDAFYEMQKMLGMIVDEKI